MQSRARSAGVTIPLFSIRTRRDWGIGQITDLPACAALFAKAGQTLVQVLPAHELADGETSPYGALSAFALDPIYIDVEAVPELDADARARGLGEEGARELDRVRGLPGVDYRAVRALKRRVLEAGFDVFRKEHLGKDTARGRAFDAFVAEEADWLRDHALYTALRERHAGYGWSTWPDSERDRSRGLVEVAKAPHDDGQLGTRVLAQMYTQWLAHEQWRAARSALRTLGVALMGDLPFIVGSESADVWAHQEQFRTDLSLGAPPDDFSAEGQSWGLPAYDWEAMDRDDLGWLRARSRHAAELFDRFRIDHVVGFFRQWVRPHGEGAHGRFYPEGDHAQLARGAKVLRTIVETTGPGVVIAEDLGVVPPWVRETLTELGIPGYKVLPWERDGQMQPYDPRTYPELSVATWSTHDTMPITSWWDAFEPWERERLARVGGFALDLPDEEREMALLGMLYASGSALALTLANELVGDRARINTPGTVNDRNWTYRLERPLEDLDADPRMQARFARIASICAANGRSG